jgi:hypothetical protein
MEFGKLHVILVHFPIALGLSAGPISLTAHYGGDLTFGVNYLKGLFGG